MNPYQLVSYSIFVVYRLTGSPMSNLLVQILPFIENRAMAAEMMGHNRKTFGMWETKKSSCCVVAIFFVFI